MDPIRSSLPSRTYEDFVPPSDWLREEGFDMLLMELPGFRKEHLKVQLDNFGNLRTFGERPLDGNRHRRFRKEFRLPDNCNTSEIRAKFEDGILTVTVPRPTTTTHAEPATLPSPARAASPATAKPPPPPPPPRDAPTFPAPLPPPPSPRAAPTLPAPPPRDAPTIPAPLPPPPAPRAPPSAAPTFVTPPTPTKTTTPEPQAMPKPSEPTKENDRGKVEEVKEETMEAMREEAADYDEAGGLSVGMKRKRKQLLVVNIVVAAILLVGVGWYVANKFKKVGEAGTTKGLLHYEF